MQGFERMEAVLSATHRQHKNVRLETGEGTIGLCTTTYSHNLREDEKAAAAKRIALMWNLLTEVSTDDLEKALNGGARLTLVRD